MSFQGVTVLNRSVLLEEKHFNTFNRHIHNIYTVTGSISGSRVSVWVTIAQLITAETVPNGRSIDAMSYVAEKLLRVPDRLRCYLSAFCNISAETTVALQRWYSLPSPLSLEDTSEQQTQAKPNISNFLRGIS